eukprot:5414579-Alexandrium_andersonii.AAC.1
MSGPGTGAGIALGTCAAQAEAHAAQAQAQAQAKAHACHASTQASTRRVRLARTSRYAHAMSPPRTRRRAMQ